MGETGLTSTWAAPGATANFPMALDETHHRLFVGFRKPAKLFVFDTESGKAVADLDIPDDADDLFYDGSRQRSIFPEETVSSASLNRKTPIATKC